MVTIMFWCPASLKLSILMYRLPSDLTPIRTLMIIIITYPHQILLSNSTQIGMLRVIRIKPLLDVQRTLNCILSIPMLLRKARLTFKSKNEIGKEEIGGFWCYYNKFWNLETKTKSNRNRKGQYKIHGYWVQRIDRN